MKQKARSFPGNRSREHESNLSPVSHAKTGLCLVKRCESGGPKAFAREKDRTNAKNLRRQRVPTPQRRCGLGPLEVVMEQPSEPSGAGILPVEVFALAPIVFEPNRQCS